MVTDEETPTNKPKRLPLPKNELEAIQAEYPPDVIISVSYFFEFLPDLVPKFYLTGAILKEHRPGYIRRTKGLD